MDFSYNQIKPLIVHEEVQGQRVYVEFQHPESGVHIEATGSIRKEKSIGAAVTRQVKRSFMQQARMTLMRSVGSLFGGGMLGRTARQVTSTASREVMSGNRGSGASAPTQSEIEAAVVSAFNSVGKQFHYDAATGKWGAAKTPPAAREKTPFEAQINSHPITDPHDKKVFARVLADLANADGNIAPEEVAFFNSIMPAGVGSIHDILATDKVSRVECEMVQDGVRGTIFMFAAALVLSDFEIDPAEMTMLDSYADMLKISAGQKDTLLQNAKVHMLESALNEDMSRDELFDLGASLGLSNDDAERAKIAWVRRQS